MRILFVSEEVAPFTCGSETADLVRILPEQLQESGEFEVRIMMPRYGIISERKNRLHEVIRLSGNVIEVDGRKETLKVKVASIPGIRLQVYFMDNNHFFKRKGIHAAKEGDVFPDNAQRAWFFSQAVLDTIHKLGWTPDIVHCFGWLSALTPLMLRTKYSQNPIFEKAKSVYTPGLIAPDSYVGSEFLDQLPSDPSLPIKCDSVTQYGYEFADMVAHSPHADVDPTSEPQLTDNIEDLCHQAKSLYEQLLTEVAV
ncbi:MAG: glycogen/starch synthase [Rhodothermaceae bacterium]|nr:glycogen/starch synthase [Rhodothermaceae bacterium]